MEGRSTVRLGTWSGIPVAAHWSLLLMLALFTWELAEYVLPASPGHAGAADWLAGSVGAVGVLVSLVVHELSHSVVARRNGVGVRGVTLFLFGGVSRLEGEAHTPGADFRIAVVGPAASLAAAGVFGAAHGAAAAAGVHGLPVATLRWLWEVNVVLAAFNMVPAAPLDGGRVLRAALWHHWSDRLRAAVAAARAGAGFGAFLVVLGFASLLTVGVAGLWSVLIGLFLYSAARSEQRYAQVQEAVAGLPVARAMNPRPTVAPARTSVAELVGGYAWSHRGDAVAVTDDQGMLAGVVTAQAVRAVPPGRRRAVTLAEIAVPLDGVPVARPGEPLGALLERMVAREGRPAFVLDADHRLAGIVTLADVERAAAVSQGRWIREAGR